MCEVCAYVRPQERRTTSYVHLRRCTYDVRPHNAWAHNARTYTQGWARRAQLASKKYPLWGYFAEKIPPMGVASSEKIPPMGVFRAQIREKNTPYEPEGLIKWATIFWFHQKNTPYAGWDPRKLRILGLKSQKLAPNCQIWGKILSTSHHEKWISWGSIVKNMPILGIFCQISSKFSPFGAKFGDFEVNFMHDGRKVNTHLDKKHLGVLAQKWK